MLNTFADRQYIGIAGDHVIVDNDPAFNLQIGHFCEIDRRLDANRHHHQIGRYFGSVLQSYASDIFIAQYLGRVRLGQDCLPAPFQFVFEQETGCLVQLPLHQGRHQVEHRDFHAAQGQTMGRFQSQQATADHHGLAAFFGCREHLVDIIKIAEGDDSRQIMSRNRDDEGVGARGDQQPVIGRNASGSADNLLGFALDRDHRIAGDQFDAIVIIPVLVIDDDFFERLVASEHG